MKSRVSGQTLISGGFELAGSSPVQAKEVRAQSDIFVGTARSCVIVFRLQEKDSEDLLDEPLERCKYSVSTSIRPSVVDLSFLGSPRPPVAVSTNQKAGKLALPGLS